MTYLLLPLLLLLFLLLLLLQVREDGVVVEQAAGCGGFGKGERATANSSTLASAGLLVLRLCCSADGCGSHR
jgi:hypothetical protein